MDAEALGVIERRLERAKEDVGELLKELKLAEDVRDACQRSGTSVHLFRQRIVKMLRNIGYIGIAGDIESERVPDVEGEGTHEELVLRVHPGSACAIVRMMLGGMCLDMVRIDRDTVVQAPSTWGAVVAGVMLDFSRTTFGYPTDVDAAVAGLALRKKT